MRRRFSSTLVILGVGSLMSPVSGEASFDTTHLEMKQPDSLGLLMHRYRTTIIFLCVSMTIGILLGLRWARTREEERQEKAKSIVTETSPLVSADAPILSEAAQDLEATGEWPQKVDKPADIPDTKAQARRSGPRLKPPCCTQ
mmetsp:Transcript_14877/g.27492  ORF Transcript_14877/g.27492 Transcript_14877/m.27492 type:complete len:143 (+) Transcript_14877:124-552(+)